MKFKHKNRIIVAKCDIEIELENDEEIIAMKNICSMAENECFYNNN